MVVRVDGEKIFEVLNKSFERKTLPVRIPLSPI
jgi:hypothetical protein